MSDHGPTLTAIWSNITPLTVGIRARAWAVPNLSLQPFVRRAADYSNRVSGYKNMYICDGSVPAANQGVNPSLTIWAESTTRRRHNLLLARRRRHHPVCPVIGHQQAIMLAGVLDDRHPRLHGLVKTLRRPGLQRSRRIRDGFFQQRDRLFLSLVIRGIEFVPLDLFAANYKTKE